ncbi:hypothetical protein QG516_19065 [Pedobacter gandavensis]|uniref:hypothetical protein n=1 Tax=Pedobacter TaxID=84567 RepID=UPI001C999479|nr:MULTISPECIES: hypothetical protein [Pedobacter]WGQ08633.1 hypothetical protein QG516_19065 [Pedobacter gandavensis]
MNNIFSLRRFSKLFIKHSQEYFKTYLLSVIVLLGLLATVLGFISYLSGGNLGVKSQYAIFFFFILGVGSIFTSMIFSDLGNSRKSIAMMTLPASHFEKYLVAWIYSFLIYQLIFVLSFYAVDFVILKLQDTENTGKIALLDLRNPNTSYAQALVAFSMIHSMAFLGAVFFEKLNFIKTASLVLLLCLLLILINYPLASSILGLNLDKVVPLGEVRIKEGEQYFNIQAQSSVRPIIQGMAYTFVLILWIGTYFKLKEKQV